MKKSKAEGKKIPAGTETFTYRVNFNDCRECFFPKEPAPLKRPRRRYSAHLYITAPSADTAVLLLEALMPGLKTKGIWTQIKEAQVKEDKPTTPRVGARKGLSIHRCRTKALNAMFVSSLRDTILLTDEIILDSQELLKEAVKFYRNSPSEEVYEYVAALANLTTRALNWGRRLHDSLYLTKHAHLEKIRLPSKKH